MTTKSAFSAVGLAHKLLLAAEAQGYDPEKLNTLSENSHLFGELLQVQWGNAIVVPVPRDEQGVLETHSPIVHVDRLVKPGTKRFAHQNQNRLLNCPKKFNVTMLERWYPRALDHNAVYNLLIKSDALKNSLSLSDIEAIRMRGIAFFREFFGNETSRITAFRSVAIGRYDKIYFPFIYKTGGESLELSWAEPQIRWLQEEPVYLFA